MQASTGFLLLAVLALAACGERNASPLPAMPAVSAATPADPALARLYEQTCKACHATGAGGAPLTADRAAWSPRMAQGMKVLMEHTVNGYQGMPPLGGCMDCGEAEFEALIRFLAGESS